MAASPETPVRRAKLKTALVLAGVSKSPSPSPSVAFDAESPAPSPSPSASPRDLRSAAAAALRSPAASAAQVPTEANAEDGDSVRKRRAGAAGRLKASVMSAVQASPEFFPDEDATPSASPSGRPGAVPKLKGWLPSGSASRLDVDEMEESDAKVAGEKSERSGKGRVFRRRSSGGFKTVALHGLAAFSALKSELDARNQDADEDNAVQNPNEVILPPDDDSDDEEEEEAERDFLSALQRVQSSGKLSMRELLSCGKELRQQTIFQDKPDATIIAGFRSAKYLDVQGNEVLWSRGGLCDSILEAESPLVLLLSGKVSVAKPGLPEGEKMHKGGVVNAGDPDVLGMVVEQECSVLYVDLPRVEKDMADLQAAREQVERELRRGRQPATWPEELINQLVLCIQDLPFFEDFAFPQLRSLARGLRFQSAREGEALPQPLHLPEKPEPSSLVVLWEGKAGKYRRVSSEGNPLITAASTAQLDHLAPVAEQGQQGIKKSLKTGASMAPSDKKDGMLPDLVPDLEEEVKSQADNGKVYLKRYGDLRLGFVLGQRDMVDPGGPKMHEPTVRCEGRCKILRLLRRDYLHCLKEAQVEKHCIVHALRNIPPSRPGEPHHRSEEQLSLLAKLVKNTPELKGFERPTLMQVLGAATYINAGPGHVLCKQGQIGDRFYAIIEGLVSIHVRPKLALEEGHAMSAVAERSGNSAFVKAMLTALVAERASRPAIPEPAQKDQKDQKVGSKERKGASASVEISPSPSSSIAPSAAGSMTPASFPDLPRGAMRRRKGVRMVLGDEGPKDSKDSSEAKRGSVKIQIQFAEPTQEPPSLPPSPQAQPPDSPDSPDLELESSHSGIPSETEGTETSSKLNLRTMLQDRGGLFWHGVRSRMKGSKKPQVDLGKMVNRLGPGAAFGAKTLLKKEARTASVMTVEPTKLLVVTREDYVALVGSMEEAKRREAAEFLCRHVLQVEVRAGSNRALDHLHPALRQRMVRTSKAMTSCTLDRGSVLLRHGEPDCKEVTILRQGAVAYCYPPGHEGKEAPRSARTLRYAAAAMPASQIVTTAGELIGVYSALLKSPEPATVRVESATCDIYRVPWADLQRVLTQRNVKLLHERLVRTHGARCETLAVHTPKEIFHVTANASLQNTVPSKEQQAVKQAFEKAFDAVSQFAEGSGEGLTSEAFIRALKSSKNFGLQSAKKPKPKAAPKFVPGSAIAREAERKAAYEKGLEKALVQLHEAAQKAGLWESLQTLDVDREVAKSRQPQQMASSHVRAQFLKVLKNEHSMIMERFIQEACLDPIKPDLNAWLQKYMKSDYLRKHPDLQELQLILRRQMMPTHGDARQHQLKDVSSG